VTVKTFIMLQKLYQIKAAMVSRRDFTVYTHVFLFFFYRYLNVST